MEFEWDPRKANYNRKKHGVTFMEAASAFDDPRVLVEHDLSHSEEEERWVAFGISEKGRLLVIAHTYRAGRIRIISARTATRTEVGLYGKA